MISAPRPPASSLNPWPRITIVTPTFERVEFLRECIESVLNQGYPNLEYIICDGGSKNSALIDLLHTYESRIAWWDSVPDRGHAEAIRRGFDRSTGEIMNWLCSDDYLLPGALFAIGRAFRENPSAEIVYGHSTIVDAQGNTLKENRAIYYFEPAAFTVGGLYQPATFWTRRVYERVGGNVGGAKWENVVFEPNVELFCRFQKARARFVRIKVFLTAMRMHDGTVNATHGRKVDEVSKRTFRRFYPLCGLLPIYWTIHFLMRFYQVAALICQGDSSYVWGEIRRKLIYWVPGR